MSDMSLNAAEIEEEPKRRTSSAYITLNRLPEQSSFKLFFRDFPYSLFQQRRKPPGEKTHKIEWQKQIEHDFEERFWDIDNKVIAYIQTFHVQ